MANDPKTFDWGPDGMVEGEEYILKSDLGLLGGANSPVVRGLPGFVWTSKGMAIGSTYARVVDVQNLMGGVNRPGRTLTSITVQSTAATVQTDVPFTFGQVFEPGDLPADKALAGVLAAGTLPLQLDVKASHDDGSVRHAVISAILPRVDPGKDIVIGLAPLKKTPQRMITMLKKVRATVEMNVEGQPYRADFVFPPERIWIDGSIALETRGIAPLYRVHGAQLEDPHPHLTVRFGLRQYATGTARLELIVENAWAYEPGPRNFSYSITVTVDGQQVYSEPSATHYHHARSRKLFWLGAEPQIHIRHDPAYLVKTRALPNIAPVKVWEKTLAKYASDWTGAKIKPMGVGLAEKGMGNTGGRPDIGIIPGWAASYLWSQDPRAKMVMLGTADLAGSWSVHYRDKNTDLPVSLLDFPYMTILGVPTDTRNPATKQQEAFPKLAISTSYTPNKHDMPHEPGLSYVPYLVTGDFYYLEELQFWAMYHAFQSNPGYRKNVQGLLSSSQVRGQAWGLRTIGEAAYITPDAHPLKKHFLQILASNLAWYNEKYSNNPNANKLGVIDGESAVIYNGKTGVAPWQDDFVTQALGHLVEMGFKDAEPFLRWKIKFPIGRMIGEGFHWMLGANYTLKVRDTAPDKTVIPTTPASPIYENFGQVYRATLGPERAAMEPNSVAWLAAIGQKKNDMGGYSHQPTGFPSNMQPALAYAAQYGGEEGRRAWDVFMGRSVKPDYGESPQFGIEPR